jgi:hypothetical protein
MSLFDNIIDALQEFKNDIISSLKNEIINLKQEIININKEKDEEIDILKQEIININKEKDEEINILKQELVRSRQELEQLKIFNLNQKEQNNSQDREIDNCNYKQCSEVNDTKMSTGELISDKRLKQNMNRIKPWELFNTDTLLKFTVGQSYFGTVNVENKNIIFHDKSYSTLASIIEEIKRMNSLNPNRQFCAYHFVEWFDRKNNLWISAKKTFTRDFLEKNGKQN